MMFLAFAEVLDRNKLGLTVTNHTEGRTAFWLLDVFDASNHFNVQSSKFTLK